MNNYRRMLPAPLLVLLLGGCGSVISPIDPQTNEVRFVQVAQDPHKQIVFKKPMVFYEGFAKTQEIIFPEGTYELEAEDEEYYYFSAPKYLETRTNKDGITVGNWYYSGGLYLTKKSFNMVPAGAYYTVDESEKVHIWRLGILFLSEKGLSWYTTY